MTTKIIIGIFTIAILTGCNTSALVVEPDVPEPSYPEVVDKYIITEGILHGWDDKGADETLDIQEYVILVSQSANYIDSMSCIGILTEVSGQYIIDCGLTKAYVSHWLLGILYYETVGTLYFVDECTLKVSTFTTTIMGENKDYQFYSEYEATAQRISCLEEEEEVPETRSLSTKMLDKHTHALEWLYPLYE